MKLKRSSKLFLALLLISSCRTTEANQADEDCYAMINSGRQSLAMHNLPKALSLFRKAKQLQPSDARPYFWIGFCLEQSQDLNGAVRAYADSIAAGKTHGMDSAELRINLGNTLSKLNYYKEAVYDYQRALQIDPDLNVAHLYLARVLLEKGELTQALSELDICSQRSVAPAETCYWRALALKGLGKKAEALQQIRQCLASLTTGDAANSLFAQKARLLENELASAPSASLAR